MHGFGLITTILNGSALSRNAKCVVTRVSHTVLTAVWALSMCCYSAYKPYNQRLFIVSRVLHRIVKLESFAFSFIILCITLETIKSRWLSVTYAKKEHVLNAHTPVNTVCDTRVTTHLALRDKAEHSEHAQVFCLWASPISCKISVVISPKPCIQYSILNAFDTF